MEAIDVVAKPRAGLAAGFFFFLAPAMVALARGEADVVEQEREGGAAV